MAGELTPEYLTIGKLLDKRLFRIREYQRMYSWQTKQRKDLFSDITKLADANGDRNHFLSTIVCRQSPEPEIIGFDQYWVYDVVDGQQRLTTLIILLRSIAKKLASLTMQGSLEASDELVKMLVKENNTKLLLSTNHDNNALFGEYIENARVRPITELQTDGDKNLVDAFSDCERFVDEWHETRDIRELVRLVKNKIGVVFYAVTDESVVYTVFEVLNSRGLVVDWLDKCKSMLMGVSFERYPRDSTTAKEKHDELKSIWTDIYRTISQTNVKGHEVVRFAATLIYPDDLRKPFSSERAYSFLEEVANDRNDGEVYVSSVLRDIAKSLRKLDENPRLKAVTSIAHCRLLAAAIELTDYIQDADKPELLDEWERVSFKIFGLSRKDARTKVGEYTSLATRLYSGGIQRKQDVQDGLEEISKTIDIKKTIEEFKRSRNCYEGWEEELRYLFYRYEEYLWSLEGKAPSTDTWEKMWRVTPSTTIEHIFPQDPSDEWSGKMGRGRDTVKNNVHRLGNLVLLPPGLNSEAGRKAFTDKKKIYRSNYLKMHDEILSQDDWTRETIDKRDAAMWEWIMNTWGD